VSGIPEGGFLRQGSGTIASSPLAAVAGGVSFFQLRTWRDTRYGRQWANFCHVQRSAISAQQVSQANSLGGLELDDELKPGMISGACEDARSD
jgi:hypothetical protein